MSTFVITNNQNLLSGIAQTIAADDPYKDLSITDRLKNSLKAFSDIQVSLASDYQSGGFLNFGVVDGQTYRVTLDNYDVWYTGSFSQFGSQISKIYVVLPGGANYLMLQGQISYSGLPFFSSMVNGSKLNAIESGATNLGFQSGFSSSDVLVDLNSTFNSGTLSGSINQISSGIFSKNSSNYAYFDQLSGGDIKFTVSNIGTVSAQASVTGTKFTNAIISIVDRQNLIPIDTISISNAFIDVVKKSSLALSSDGSDSYILQGSLPSRIESGAGNDTITGTGFSDSLVGGDGKDSLVGLDGNDYLDGGIGEDTLNGGSGDDIYVIDSVGDVILGEENSDGNSAVQVIGAINFALASNQRINLLSAGELSYVNGSITSTFTNTNAANIKGNDFNQNLRGNAAGNKLEGAGGDDGIDGKGGNDTLDGGDGNDWLDGGAGNDSLSGGAGDDTLWGDYGQMDPNTFTFGSGGKDSLVGGAGIDKVYLALSESDYFVSKNDTTIILTRKLDASSVTTIDRTQSNGVELISFQGGPTINVSDLLSGAATSGNDNLFQRTSLATTNPLVIDGLAGNDTITGIDGLGDSLAGGDGNDSLVGLGGGDYLDGGAGDDTLNGGSGDDIYVIDSVGDVILGEENSDGNNAIQVKGSISFVLAAKQKIDLISAGEINNITNVVNIKGNELSQRIDGNAASNKLEGAGGDDFIVGWDGNDILDGGDGNDVIDCGTGNDSVNGGAGDDKLWLDWPVSNSSTFRNGGKDTIVGGAGNDTVYIGFAENSFSVSKADNSITLTNKADTSNILTIDRSLVNGVEIIRFFEGNDISLTDFLAGAATIESDNLFQRDSLVNSRTGFSIDGLAGNDTITGTEFSDSLAGGDGKDSLVGLLGNDYLDGGVGDDTLDGGAGEDLYIVDSVSDVIKGEEIFEVSSFGNPSSNALQVKGAISYVLANGQNVGFLSAGQFDSAAFGSGASTFWTFTNTNIANIKGNDFGQVIYGNAAGNKLEGAGGDDRISGAAGNDILDGGIGSDFLMGELGDDTLDGGTGIDYLEGGAGNDSLSGGAGDDWIAGDFGDFNQSTQSFGSSGKDSIAGGADTDTVRMRLSETDYSITATETTITLTNRIDPKSVSIIDTTQANGVEFIVFGTDPTITSITDLLAGAASTKDDVLYLRGTGSYNGSTKIFTPNSTTGTFSINGGEGNDLIFGTMNSDSLVGDAGKDSLSGGGGNDFLDGGEGEDTVDYSALDKSILVKLNGSEFGVVEKGGLLPVLNLSFEGVNLSNSFGSNVTIVGNPFISTSQKNSGNSSIYFDGRASGIGINNSDLNLGVSDFVIDFYFKTDGSQNRYSVILSSMHDSGWGELNNGTSDGGILNYFNNGVLLDGVNLNDGAWHHFEGGQVDGLAFLKIDNNLLDSELRSSASYNFNNLLIGKLGGRWIGNSDNSFRGWIDDFKISKYMPISDDRISNIENVIGSKRNDDIEGDNKRNILSGRDGADFISGAENNDVLQGEVGNDSLNGGEGRDYLNGGEGNDYLDGGAGIDLLIGGTGDDIYVVDSLRDVIIDQSGWDTIKSENLNEINLQRYRGIEAAEYTGTESVALIGNHSSNSLIGGTGADTLTGKFGNDTLTGASGSDKFVFNTKLDGQFNFDQITDFSTGIDKLVLDKTIFARFTNAVQDSNLVMGMDPQDTDDYLIYDSNTQTLYYDADGNAVGAKVAFVQVVGINSLSSADFSVI